MKRNLTILAILSLCTLLSCTQREKITVYKVRSLDGLKTLDLIKGETVLVDIADGDTVSVNLDDSVIEHVKREDGHVLGTGIRYNYIVESSFESYKD